MALIAFGAQAFDIGRFFAGGTAVYWLNRPATVPEV